jgi:uncharacterized repeat protein (TIGR01451 family)
VFGSHDPNFKAVLNRDALDKMEAVQYAIHFQNTGTAPAVNVLVEDVLPIQCNLGAVHFISSSHPCGMSLESRTLRFTFNTILLPDSATDEPASHGFVRFAVDPEYTKSKPTCDTIKNTASIYFDFNDPIRTNEAVVFVHQNLHVPNWKTTANEAFSLYPNPGNSALHVKRIDISGADIYYLFDLQGRVIASQTMAKGMREISFELSDSMGSGVYFVRNIAGQSLKWVLMR